MEVRDQGELTLEITRRLTVERANERLAHLQALAAALARAPRLADVVQVVVECGFQALGAVSTGIFLYAADRATLELVGQRGMPAALLKSFPSMHAADDHLTTATAARTGQPVWIDGPEELLQRSPTSAVPSLETGIEALASLPLRVDDRILGAVTFAFQGRRRLSDEERSFALTAADQCAQALDRALAHADAERASVRTAHLYQEAERARAEAEAANQAKDDFLATLSHELRTPLTAILGWADVLRTRSVEPPALARGLAAIERNGKTLVHLIEDILDVSRIVSGKLHVEIRAVDPAALLRAALDVVRPMAEARRVLLDAAIDDEVGMVAADPDRFQQIAWNLLSNAIKFTPKGGRVAARLDRVDAGVRLLVVDTGAGIEAGFLPHVFERFRQANGSHTRGHGGLGLGLAIVKHLVELQEGTITAASEGPGLGASFTVVLPASPQGAVERDGPRSTDPGTPLLAQLEGVRVLIVDDEPDARELIAALLREQGAHVTEAASAAEAIVALDRELPDVLVSDIGMPDEDGYMLLQRVRARGSAPQRQLPALALTAYVGAHDVRTAERAGFQRHLAKPVVPARLIEEVTYLAGVAGRKARNEAT